MVSRLIVVDDDHVSSEFIRSTLQPIGFKTVHTENNPSQAEACLQTPTTFDAALINVSLMNGRGQDLLMSIKKKSPATECIAIAPLEDKAAAIRCLRKGAYDFLIKPFTSEELVAVVRRALERKTLLDIFQAERSSKPPALVNPSAFKEFITNSLGLLRVLKTAELHAAGIGPVLIAGEWGTGKKLLAKAIHDASHRMGSPFQSVDAAAWRNENDGEALGGRSEETVAGTDSQAGGYLKHCQHGTLLIEEIANLPIEMQDKLLPFLQEDETAPPADGPPQKADVRLIATTKADLPALVGEGKFRGDLFCRLRGNWLHLPPLRERPEDISLLSHYYLKKWGLRGRAARLDPSAAAAFEAYNFPGNLNELQALLREAVELAHGKQIAAEHLPVQMRRSVSALPERLALGNPTISLAEIEKQHILSVYQQTNYNKVRAARALGIGLNTLRRKLKAYEAIK
jgi:DNA-binding NtrC family response regulator